MMQCGNTNQRQKPNMATGSNAAVPMSLYCKLTEQLIQIGRFRPCPGHAMIAIWKNADHLLNWKGVWRLASDDGDDSVRFLTVPLTMLTMIKIPPTYTARQVTVLGIGYSARDDLTDLQLYYRRFVA